MYRMLYSIFYFNPGSQPFKRGGCKTGGRWIYQPSCPQTAASNPKDSQDVIPLWNTWETDSVACYCYNIQKDTLNFYVDIMHSMKLIIFLSFLLIEKVHKRHTNNHSGAVL